MCIVLWLGEEFLSENLHFEDAASCHIHMDFTVNCHYLSLESLGASLSCLFRK